MTNLREQDAKGVGDTIRAVLAAGAVGVNVEDALYDGGEPLRPVAEQTERIAAAREAADSAGVPLFVNARIVRQRPHRYVAAGAVPRGSCWTRGRTSR
jgi:2-methylisocitrate lyase-like PEP mutase family enzyme